MDKLIIEASQPLRGTVKVDGAKNSVLPIMAASLLTHDMCTIYDVPDLSDAAVMEEILNHLGAHTAWNKAERKVEIRADKTIKTDAPYELVSRMRASFLITGPLLARTGYASIPLPGGCAIGARPIELHLKGFAAMGAQIVKEHGFVSLSAKRGLVGAKIYLDFPSVGATENIMMAATLAEGQTIIENCAVEPEIVDLAYFLNAIGGDIRGAGTDTIKINGVRELRGASHNIIPDRIEAGTFMVAAALTGGDITVENVVWDHLKPVIAKLIEAGATVEQTDVGLRVWQGARQCIRPIDVKTMPYPGFPTDMQAQFIALLTIAEGTSIVTETVFENRFMHVGELKRMGANIKIEGRSAIIEGTRALTGASVRASDLRAGAALVLAGLVAEGTTELSDVYHLERGYCGFLEKLRRLGASLEAR